MSYAARRKFLWILFIASLALLAAVANATTLSRLQFKELAQQSTAVARLRCLRSMSKWERGEIWTETQFEVLEQNKGFLPGLVTVQMPGGSIANLHSRVESVPTFRSGEEVYLFLWSQAGEPYRVLGWTQGTFRIARDEQSGVEKVTQDSAATPLFDPIKRVFRHDGIRNLPVAVFRLKLHLALRGSGQ